MAQAQIKYTARDYYTGDDQGYYQNLTLQNIIDTFMVAYTGEDKVLRSVPRHEVALWGQRAVQEFSYDILRSEKVWELELNPDTLIAQLPQDYVSFVDLKAAVNVGTGLTAVELQLYRAEQNFMNTQPIQDGEYDFIYNDEDGLLEGDSITLQRFQRPPDNSIINLLAESFYYSTYDAEYSLYGRKRYGINPKDSNIQPRYFVAEDEGRIYLSSAYTDLNEPILKLKYISDGLGAGPEFGNILVPKLAEQAVYNWILYKLCSVRPSAVSLASGYKQEARAEMRNAKIRLTNYSPHLFYQDMKQKAKWIKY